MKNDKKSSYSSDTSKDIKEQQLSEPEICYTITPNATANRTMALMGMLDKKGHTSIKNESDFIQLVREGIPKQAMLHLMELTNISLDEMVAIIHTSDRTLRRYKPEQKLPQEQSEKMVEMARLYGKGEDVFGGIDAFNEWMNTVLLPLGNKKPKEFLDTSLGINMLMDELGRIEHGIMA